MISAYTRALNQVATYWSPGANDGFGNVVFNTAIEIKCRWQDVAVLFRNAQGVEVTSSSVVYPNQALLVNGYIALGAHTATSDPHDINGSREIRQAGSSPSLRGDKALNKVWL